MKKLNNQGNKALFFFLGAQAILIFFVLPSLAEAATDVADDILTDTVWDTEGSPYVVRNDISVALGATLSIEPGVIVKFDPAANKPTLYVFGDLVVNGKAEDKVYFTSYYDDAASGDTNGDYVCEPDIDEAGNPIENCASNFEPAPGNWGGIIFFDSHNDYLQNVVFRYGEDVVFMDHTYLNLKNVEISHSKSGISGSVSNIDADKANCLGLTDPCMMVYDGSTLNWNNSLVDTISDDAIYVFNNSFLNAEKLQVKNIIGNIKTGAYVFNNAHLTLRESSFENCLGGDCITIFDSDSYVSTPSSLEVENSIFNHGPGSAIFALGDSKLNIKIYHSIIKNFDNFAMINFSSSFQIDAKDNFWGDSTGPFHPDLNPTGTAGVVYDGVDFMPFCKNEKCKGPNPVILIPGIMGTSISKNYSDNLELWPNPSKLLFSITDSFMKDLALKADGTEYPERPMHLGDIIRKVDVDILGIKYTSHSFDGLIDELTSNGYKEGENLFVFPYDWRKSNKDSADNLKDKIAEILKETGAQKVDIVAHSMGGLVAKKYIADNGASYINQLVFIGTPHLGAPNAFKALMYGDDMGIRFGFSILNPSIVKTITQNMPGVFELLPSQKYVDGDNTFLGQRYVEDLVTPRPIVLLTNDLSYAETKDFMIRQGRNSAMFPIAEDLHNSTDNLDLSGVKVANFIGCGATKTITKITAKKKRSLTSLWLKLVDDFKLGYGNGDDTVPVISANRADSPGARKFYVKNASHAELPSTPGLTQDIFSILDGSELQTFDNVSKDIGLCEIDGIVITLQTMIDMLPQVKLNVYDDAGNHTGPTAKLDPVREENPDNIVEIENGIPGVEYNQIGGTTSIFIPKVKGKKYKIDLTDFLGFGPDPGDQRGAKMKFNLVVEKINGQDEKTSGTVFNDESLNIGETAEINLPEEVFGTDNGGGIVIGVDKNGDGIPEEEIPPTVILDSVEVNDTVAPSTTPNVSLGMVTLLPNDDNSGVAETLYSLDGGETWIKYEGPFDLHLTPGGPDVTVKYFSIDQAGNLEQVKEIIVHAPPAPVVAPVVGHTTPAQIFSANNSSSGPVMPEIKPQTKPEIKLETKPDNKTDKLEIQIGRPAPKKLESPTLVKREKEVRVGIPQSASAINSETGTPSPYWPVIAVTALGSIFVAKRFIKYKIKK